MKLPIMAKPAKIFPIVLWGLVVCCELVILLVSTLTNQTDLLNKITFSIQVLLVSFFIQLVIFLLFIPHWLVLIITSLVLKKTKHPFQSFLQIACISNLIMLLLGIIMSIWCNFSAICSSEGPLASGEALIIFFILCQLVFTLPFLFGLNKLLYRQPKKPRQTGNLPDKQDPLWYSLRAILNLEACRSG